MKRYFDTGVVLKLYTVEPESAAVRQWVTVRAEPIPFSSLHLSECVSALRLKCFRRECREEQVAGSLLDLENDLATGVLGRTAVDWEAAWNLARVLSDAHAAATGCRTLDVLHVACARQWGAQEFVTTDARQAKLARKVGLRVPRIG